MDLVGRISVGFFAVLLLCATSGCLSGESSEGVVWGRRGLSDGRLQKPRAMALDEENHVYLVDMTARIQVFDTQGGFLRGWQTPEHEFGRPTGISIDRRGNVLVADTHYYRVLIYSPEGELLRTVGGTPGPGPGEFGLVTDVVEDSHGNFYVSEYGDYDRIQKFDADWNFLLQWGGHGSQPGEFVRPQNLLVDEEDNLWVADACNHRIQIFDSEGNLKKIWGEQGNLPGQLYYPYDLVFDHDGNLLIVEYANHRVQKFTRDGKPLGCWGTHGRQPGQLHNPWALVCDQQGWVHVLDTNNHRVQRFRL